MRLTPVVSGSLLVMVLALTGCGGDDSDGDAGSDDAADAPPSEAADSPADEPEPDDPAELDVCALLSADDLEAAFASPFGSGELTHQDETGADQCVWTNTDPPPVKVFSITVLREDHLSGAFEEGGVTVASLHENTKAAYGDVEELDLGDDSYLAGSTLAVLDGDTEYTFTTTTGTSAEAINGMKTLAEQVIG